MTAQAPRLDVITENVGENVRRVQARDLGATVVQALFRLVKQSTLHSLDNQAVVRQVEDAAHIINDYGQRTDQNVSLLFAFGSIFVGGSLLKANRQVYEGATELGEILKKYGFSELAIARNVTPQDLFAFVAAMGEAHRSGRSANMEKPSARIRLRAVAESALRRGATVERLDEHQAVIRMYASAIVIMRRFFEQLQKGRYDLPQRVKRIAQMLVDLSKGDTPSFLGVTSARNANQDEAGRAVNTAILSVSIARQITDDIVVLARVGMAALLFDTARPRLTNTVGPNAPAIVPRLSEAQELESPAATAAVMTALGHVNEPTVMRTVLTYEAHWVRRARQLGPVYRGLRPATLQARIVAIARRFNDLLTPAPGADPMSADDAVSTLESEATDAGDHTVIRLLIAALGIFPMGTLVQLSSGEMALVLSTPAHPSQYSQPRVRVMFDGNGRPLPQAADVELSQLKPNDPRKQVARIVSPADDASKQQARAAKVQKRNTGVHEQGSGQSHGHQAPSGQSNPSGHVSQESSFTPSQVSGVAPRPSPAPGQMVSAYAPQQPYTPHPNAQHAAYPAAPYPPQQPSAPPPAHALAPPHAQPPHSQPPVDDLDAGTDPGGGYQDDEGATRAVAWGARASAPPPPPQSAPSAPPSRPQLKTPPPGQSPVPAAAIALAPPRAKTPPPEPQPAPEAPPPTPTAEGTLVKTPLVHLLVYMLDQRLTGTALFQTPDNQNHGLYFEKGVPCKIRTGGMVAPLDRVLVEMGALDEASLRQSLMEVSKKRMLHGRFLVSRGLVDGGTIMKALKQQLVHKLIFLFDLAPETRYAFYADHNLLASYGGPELTPVEPLAIIMTGVRLRSDDPLIDQTLAKLTKRPIALHLDAELKRFDFRKDEAGVADLLRIRKMTFDEMLAAGVAQERVLRLTLYALAITRHLDIGGGRPPVGVTMRDRIRRSGVVEPGPVAIREAEGESEAPRQRDMTPVPESPRPVAMAPEAPPSPMPPSPRIPEPAPSPAGHDYAPPPPVRMFTPSQPAPAVGMQPIANAEAVGGTMVMGPAQTAALISGAQQAPPPGMPVPTAEQMQAQQAAYQQHLQRQQQEQLQQEQLRQQQLQQEQLRQQQMQQEQLRQQQMQQEQLRQQQMQQEQLRQQQMHYEMQQQEQLRQEQLRQQQLQQEQLRLQQIQQQGDYQRQQQISSIPQANLFSAPPGGGSFGYQPPPAPMPTNAPPPQQSAPPPAAPSGAGTRPPPGHLSMDHKHRWQEIELKASRIDKENYYEMLDVPKGAPDPQVQAAYFKLAKAWHPDRLPAELVELKPTVSTIFARFNEAYNTLNDPTKRFEYEKSMAAGGPGGGEDAEAEAVQRVVDAAIEFQKAEVMMKKNDLAGAESYAKRAALADPDQVEYIALLTWIQGQRRGDPPIVPEGKTSSFYDDLISIYDGILAKEPMYERALYYRAVLLKRAGKEERAMRDFRLVVQLNPKNIDAVREVRINQMRKDKKRKDEAGILGKLFKK